MNADTREKSTEAGRYNPGLFENARWDDAPSKWELKRFEHTLALIPEETHTVLDVGCGGGNLTHRIAERGHQVMGTDYAFEGLARLRVPGVRASADALPFPDDAFDVVVCSEVIEHLPSPLFEDALKELWRVARRSVVITVPYRETLSDAHTACPNCGEVFNAHGHLRSFEPAVVASLLPGNVRTSVLAKPRRYYDPRLMWVMQNVLHRYGYIAWAVCPSCGNDDFSTLKTDLVRKGLMGINHVLHRGKMVTGGWILARFDKPVSARDDA
ncbi:MAG: class I SAM-dependent methyltransferase [Bradymonadia bacterium]